MRKSLFILTSLLVAGVACASGEMPNVVLIFADDLGYGDLGCYGATRVQTPNIDKLAAEGRRFTDAHSASAVCTPSRYGLLTGEYPVRRGLWGPCSPGTKLLIHTEKLTIADIFKNKGYDTAAIGKWHLGFGEKRPDWNGSLRPGPQDLGFDYYFGVPIVNSCSPYLFVENDRVVGLDPADPLVNLGRGENEKATPITPIPREAAQRNPNSFSGGVEAHKLYNDYKIGTELASRSVQWIKERTRLRQGSGGQEKNPFFLYLATTNIHHPFTPDPRFQGTSQAGLYGDFIHELDWMVGEVVKALEEQGVADNTLIIFTSDNGGMFNAGGFRAMELGHELNGKLLGSKFDAWEGGHRVPFIAKWAGEIPAGTESSQLLCNVDMLATFAALTEQVIEPVQLADSVSMLPAFLGEPTKPLRDHLIISPFKKTHLTIRKGKWVYIGAQGNGGFPGKKPGSHFFAGPAAAAYVGRENSDISNGKIKKDAPPAQLYDLAADVNQTKNVYNEYPEVVKEMAALLDATYKPAEPKTPKRKPKKKKENK